MKTLLFLLMVILLVMLSGFAYSNSMVNAEQVDRFWCVLDGRQQVPPNTTYAHGFIGLKFTEDLKRLVYNINLNDIHNLTGIYLYSSKNNMHAANMILDLFEQEKEVKLKSNADVRMPKVNQSDVEGTVAIGGVTSQDLRGELKGKSLQDLKNLMMSGGVHVTVQTKDFPLGEIRGNEFIPIDRIFPDIADFQWN